MQTLESRLNIVEPVVLVSMQLPNRPGDDFRRLVNEATKRDLNPISGADEGRILDTDLIIRGRHSETGDSMYFAAEASHTVEADDIGKVVHTRTALEGMIGPDATVIGAVFGVNIEPDEKRLARASSLIIYEIQLPT